MLKNKTAPKTWMEAKKVVLARMPWASSVPFQVKGIAVKDAYQAFHAGIRKFKKTGVTFELHFKRRRSPRQSIYIPKSALRQDGAYRTKLGSLKMPEPVPADGLDSRMLLENGRYFLCVPSSSYMIAKSESQAKAIIALDPGVRTFLTGYSPEKTFKIGEGVQGRIIRLSLHLDKLISRMKTSPHRKRSSLKRAAWRLRNKISDLKDELHWKAARYLASHEAVILPPFETQQMSKRLTRKIRTKSVRAMLSMGHFQFAGRLAQRVTVLRCSEAYTSKTVSWTGEIKNIGGSRYITSYGVSVDRDINGARGIFLRALVDSPSLLRSAASAMEE